ncbi:MAG: AAA family ATPase, partial [Chloroflexi bacterium]|nr:AAA family ATPase [Chloroflexota bacterium]
TELERFGGTVEKFIGDAVMALFGAPVAHEDDPERAVRAALAIRDWVTGETDLHVRIAVNTGEALVSLGARPAEGEGMASGDVVNTTSRLQSAAPVDGVLVGEATWRATERVIQYEPADPVVAKGKAEPLRVWRAVQARSRFGVDLARASGAALVGREREVEVLVSALGRAIDERAPQLVTIVGVPGIGKSRLLAELFGTIERGDQLITWRQGRSLPYGEGVSYWALGEMVKAQAGILETDAPEEAAAKLGEAVGRLVTDAAEARWVETHLRPLAGLGTDEGGGDRRGEAFAAWRRFFEALAEQRPAVLVFEDLHWADDGLLDFVDQLVDWLTDVPVLVVGTARPELLARRPAWSGGKANAATVSLAPLSDEDTARLVHALLERSVLPAEVQAMLLERAGGNPLYAEEFARMVAERGHDQLELPGSVQGIIAARLDSLDPGDKTLLQDAAVVGKVFWSGALATIAGRDRFEVEERLHALERRELVRRERRSSVAGESEYAFRHVLVRDVAYGAIPRTARAERHRRAAEWIESLGRPDDHADLLAHHYLSVLELSRAAGSQPGWVAGSAARALQMAGDRAFALNAFERAARLYDEALAIGVDAASRPAVLFRLGSALHRAADERRYEVLEQAGDALLEAGDPETAAEAAALLAEAWWFAGETARADEHLARAQELVRDRGASAAGARVLAAAARTAALQGRFADGLDLGREALRMAETLGLDELLPHALIDIGLARHGLGDLAGGVADLERAMELAVATNNVVAARAYNNLAAVTSEDGDTARATELWREGLRVAERLGNLTVKRFIEGQLFWLDWDAGRWDEALAGAEAFIAACEAGSPHFLHASALWMRAVIELARASA